MGNRSIKKRKYIAVKVRLASPLSISGGTDEMTDADVLVNGSGEVFIPGTSLAGAIRNYLELQKDERGMMGYSRGKEGRMSALYLSDLYFENEEERSQSSAGPTVSVRDGVKLTREKTVENKFDMQVIETGAVGMMYLNYVIRENDEEEIWDRDIHDVLCAIQNGSIRVGANKNRGFGRLSIAKIWQKTFAYGEDSFDISMWLGFKKNAKDINLYSEGKTFEEWNGGQPASVMKKYVKLTVPLKLTGGISIRKYSTQPGKADYEHLTCDGKPVIPGSSWNGAIRADIRDILTSLGMTQARVEEWMDLWFGKVSVNDKTAWQSRVVVGESVIEGATALPITRNKINRFDASTIDGALYSEIAYFGGRTKLEIMVRKDTDESENNYAFHALLAVLEMVVKDIQEGYVPVGGLTAVGRGIFEKDEEHDVVFSEEISMDNCRAELYSLL
ncbi:MAG: RAMP superfamily CRISPR-associated protein [Clostridiales bacterium]|nr:RAMP superfamily CRISPR-associated protein [Clostridiales bacterium]